MKLKIIPKFFAFIFVAGLFSQLNCSAQSKTPIPVRDPADQPFRRAPMADSTRSIAVSLATNLNIAFDAELLRTHTAWAGPSLNLLGPPYTGKKMPAICNFDGKTLWTTPPFYPWAFGEKAPGNFQTNVPSNAQFRGVSDKNVLAIFIYDVALSNGGMVRVHETPFAREVNGKKSVVRRFEIAPCAETLWFLAHAEMGKVLPAKNPATIAIQRAEDVISATVNGAADLRWEPVELEADYEIEHVTDVGSLKGNPREKIQGHQTRALLKIPPHHSELAFEITTVVNDKVVVAPTTQVKPADLHFVTSAKNSSKTAPKISRAEPAAMRPPGIDGSFRIEHFPLPREIDLLVSGMDWLPDGKLAVCTWPGEIYIVENAQGEVNKATYRRFARGLNEPMGLKVVDGKIVVAQKAELTRVIDTDGNGEADLYETINDDWGYSGSYDSFAFGPAVDHDGNFYVALTGNRGRWDVPFMGWAVKISSDGAKLEGISSGLRALNGIGSFGANGEIFVTDNQGEWIGACKLNHIQRDKFFGFPSSYPAPKIAPKSFDAPAIWFPRKWSPSTSDFAEIPDERFGPFKGQMIVGDFQNAVLLRVMLEKVNGAWQGAVWPFAKGFYSGINRLAFGPDGKLYVGGCQRAWASTVPQPYSLDRVSFSGKTPFEIAEVHARPNGFELNFTMPVDAEAASKIDNYDVAQFRYNYTGKYGSPEIDFDGNDNSSSPITVKEARVSADKKKVMLVLDGWRAGYVTTVHCLDLKTENNEPLRHDTFYYTLNQIPR